MVIFLHSKARGGKNKWADWHQTAEHGNYDVDCTAITLETDEEQRVLRFAPDDSNAAL